MKVQCETAGELSMKLCLDFFPNGSCLRAFNRIRQTKEHMVKEIILSIVYIYRVCIGGWVDGWMVSSSVPAK